MTPNRRPRCSLPTPLGNRSSTTSPSARKPLHELGNFRHFLSVVFVSFKRSHLSAKCITPTRLLGVFYEGRSNCFGARKTRCLKVEQGCPLRLLVESNGNSVCPRQSLYHILSYHYQFLQPIQRLRVSSFYQKSVHIGLAKFESESRVQSIGRLARGPRREVDRSNVAPARLFDRRVRQASPTPHSSSGTVHDDVFDPRPQVPSG